MTCRGRLKRTCLLAAGLFSVLLYLFWVGRTGIGIPCVFHRVTGLLCPGCGATRCLTALLRLDFAEALRANVALILLSPFWIWLLVAMARGYLAGTGFRPGPRQQRLIAAALAFVLLFGVVRNLPGMWVLRPF